MQSKTLIIRLLPLLLSMTLLACAKQPTPIAATSPPPNILLIMVDDMGYSDLSSFGSEIPTPNLDLLAEDGVRLTNFITSSVCSPTRASVLTGVPPHLAGFGNLAEELAPNQKGQPGYEGYLNDRVVTVATLLKDAGYQTYMTGKWHLGERQQSTPQARGFERSFAMMKNASHFADMKPAYSPDPNAKADYREDGERLQSLPESFEYSSQFFVDRLIDYLKQGDPSKPFFGYLAFSAPHWPIQAPDDAIAAFQDKYQTGYDAVAQSRFERQKALGLIPATSTLAQRPPKSRPWEELSKTEQERESRAMEVYAAMIAEIDKHSGRLFEYLRNSGQFENTVIIFMSDNGAEGHDLDETWPQETYPKIRQVINERFDFSTENMGRPGSYTFYGPSWAQASSPAFYLHKGFASEGGVRTAAFVYSSKKYNSARLENRLITARDIAPTILDLAGVSSPGRHYRNRTVEPMSGQSFLPLLTDTELQQERVHVDEAMGKISVRKGPWKLTRMPKPYGNDSWQLFNLNDDLREANDLASQFPDRVAELVSYWEIYAQDNGVILPDWLSGY